MKHYNANVGSTHVGGNDGFEWRHIVVHVVDAVVVGDADVHVEVYLKDDAVGVLNYVFICCLMIVWYI